MVRRIAHLYTIEARLRRRGASAKLRATTRQAESRPIIDRIGAILTHWKKRRRHLPQSVMGAAVNYTLNLWDGLRVYLEDGRVEIDNNEIENAIRPTAVGKKNWLFIGDAEAGERSAIVFTVIEACRRRGIDPFAYLRDVFTRMPQMAARNTRPLLQLTGAPTVDQGNPKTKTGSARRRAICNGAMRDACRVAMSVSE
jgi:hypothetical protein